MGGIRTGNHHAGRRPALTSATLLIAATLTVAAAPPAPASLCAPADTPLFTCPIGHKLVSVCTTDGKPTYEYGTPGHVEISSQALSTAEHAYSGGGETQITFRNKSYTYTVFDKTTRTSFSADGHNDPDFTSGLLVQKNGKTIASNQCGTDATIAATATHLIAPGPFIEH